ncbi:hypothetical protein ABH944_008424 [Caballeronia udeis]|uniref:Uncharacterized protein n=1 Tax=Caballeronia udeis TaxID=1232866 RepID=A0ABW8N029_9BURK
MVIKPPSGVVCEGDIPTREAARGNTAEFHVVSLQASK